jgi:hypothetical protein
MTGTHVMLRQAHICLRRPGGLIVMLTLRLALVANAPRG